MNRVRPTSWAYSQGGETSAEGVSDELREKTKKAFASHREANQQEMAPSLARTATDEDLAPRLDGLVTELDHSISGLDAALELSAVERLQALADGLILELAEKDVAIDEAADAVAALRAQTTSAPRPTSWPRVERLADWGAAAAAAVARRPALAVAVALCVGVAVL